MSSCLRGERGATFVECALAVALVAVAAIAGLSVVGASATDHYQDRGASVGEPEAVVTTAPAASTTTIGSPTTTTTAATTSTTAATTSTTGCTKPGKCKDK